MPKKTGKRGRPKNAPGEGKTVTFAMRATPEDLFRIDQESVRAKKSRSKFILDTLNAKMEVMEEPRPDLWAVAHICAKVVKYAEQFSGVEWHESSFMPAVIGPAIAGVLANYSNTAPMVTPEKIEKLALPGQEPPTTPAEVARIIQMLVVADFDVSDFRKDPENPTMWSALTIRTEKLNKKLDDKDKTTLPSDLAKDMQAQHALRLLKQQEG